MYERTVFPNGLRLLTSSMPHVRSVSVGVFVGTGSRHESDELAGASQVLGMALVGARNGPVQRLCQGIVRAAEGGVRQDRVGGQHVHLHGLLRQPPERGLEGQLFERAKVYGSARAQRDRDENSGEDAGQQKPVLGNVLCYEA